MNSGNPVYTQLLEHGLCREAARFNRCKAGLQCGLDICQNCNQYRASKRVKEITRTVSVIDNAERQFKRMLNGTWQKLVTEFETCLQSLSQTKRLIGEHIQRLMARIDQLDKWVEVTGALNYLRKVRKRLRSPGEQTLGDDLRTSLWLLQQAVTRRLGYSFQSLTLNRYCVGNYRRDMMDTKRCTTNLMRQLTWPGSGAFVRFPIQSHIHAHILFWGPSILEEDLACGWLAVTQDSDRVHVRSLRTRTNVAKWITYLCYQHVDPGCWLMTRGLRLQASYGQFRSRQRSPIRRSNS